MDIMLLLITKKAFQTLTDRQLEKQLLRAEVANMSAVFSTAFFLLMPLYPTSTVGSMDAQWTYKPCYLVMWILSHLPYLNCWQVILRPCVLTVTLLICPIVCPVIYLSSSISRLDSLSDSCLHKASLRSISLWSFLCRRMFSSLMCRSSSMYWARFSVSGENKWQQRINYIILSTYCGY